MTKEEFKVNKKLYGKKIDNWPFKERMEAHLYLADVERKKSDILSKVAVVLAVTGAVLQILGLVLKFIASRV